MSRRLPLLAALITALAACADPQDPPPNLIILLPDAAPDQDAPDQDAPDQDTPDMQDAPDQDAPDMQDAPDLPPPPPDMPPDMPPADMPPDATNPCAAGLTDDQRLDAWRAERTTPDLYRLATREVAGRATLPNHLVDFDALRITVTRRAGGAVLMDCSLRAGTLNACLLECSGPMAPPSGELYSSVNLTLDQGCYFSGVGIEPPHLSFAISHIDYESWVWTFDMDAARMLQSMRSVGPVLIKYFEHRGECLRLWHTRDGDNLRPVVRLPAFKLYDIRQGLWLPRMSTHISEEDFFEQAANRVAID